MPPESPSLPVSIAEPAPDSTSSISPGEAESATPGKTPFQGYDREWKEGYLLGSRDSDKYHDRECSAARKITPENEIWFESEEAAKEAGYSRCGICNRGG